MTLQRARATDACSEPAMAAGPRDHRGAVADLALERRGAGRRSRRLPAVVVERLGRATAGRGRALHPVGPAAAGSARGDRPVALTTGCRTRPSRSVGATSPGATTTSASIAVRSRGPSRSPSTTSCRGRKGARRPGPTAWPLASSATPARATARRSRPACGSAAGRFGPNGSRSTPHRCPDRKLGQVSGSRAGAGHGMSRGRQPPILPKHRGVLLGEQRASKTRGQGSNPCTPAHDT